MSGDLETKYMIRNSIYYNLLYREMKSSSGMLCKGIKYKSIDSSG